MILLKIIALANKEGAYDTLKKTTPHLVKNTAQDHRMENIFLLHSVK